MSTNRTIQTPPDALSTAAGVDVISTSDAHTLDEMFRERVRRSPEHIAYRQYDKGLHTWQAHTWAEIALQVERWQVAFREQGLEKGDRIAICFRNSVEWVVFDQAALRLGLVVVPLYTADRADNMAYVIADAGVKLLLLEHAHIWSDIEDSGENLEALKTILVANPLQSGANQERLTLVQDWLPEFGQHLERGCAEPDDLASIIYTSGTTGRPKGVMLSHRNMLVNAHAGLRSVPFKFGARLLSFLPLSHALERTVGYYASVMSGSVVAFNRSIAELSEDLAFVKPTILISVPRIFERVHNKIYEELAKGSSLKRKLFEATIDIGWARFEHQQGRGAWKPSFLIFPLLDALVAKKVRAQLGGELEFVIVGGAPLTPQVAKTFISLGVPLLQGYGLTESSPIVSGNILTMNKPDSIGLPLRGVEAKIMENDELWVRGDNVMQGYWGLDEATNKTLEDNWLKTGDRAAIDEQGYLRIIGRIKDILVLANGEKVSPTDIEAAIMQNPLFEQVLVIGEAKSYLSALVVLNEQLLEETSASHNDGFSDRLIEKIAEQMDDFPGYANIRKVHVCTEPWTIENGLLTPTLKMKRNKIIEAYKSEVDGLYEGHGVHGA